MDEEKEEICGVNTAKLPILNEKEKEDFFAKKKPCMCAMLQAFQNTFKCIISFDPQSNRGKQPRPSLYSHFTDRETEIKKCLD